MAQLGYSFDPDQVPDDERDFALMPDGVYLAHIIESDLKGTSTGGQMLALTWEIMDGPCQKRHVWENLNIVNSNAQAQDIAARALKNICRAIGHQGALTDSADLHFKPCRIRVGHEDAKGAYKAKNTVKGYEPLSGAAPALAATPQTQHRTSEAEPAKAAGGGAPWRK